MNIRNVIERLQKIYLDEHSEDYTKCDLMEHILRCYEKSIIERIDNKFNNDFFSYSNHDKDLILLKKLNSVVEIINQRIEGIIIEPNINIFVCHENIEICVDEYLVTTDMGKTISQSAYEDSYFTCTHCENVFHNDEQRTFYENEHDLYCNDCVSEHGFYCDNCDDHHHENYTCDERGHDNLDAFDTKVDLHFLGKIETFMGVDNIPFLRKTNNVLFYGYEVELHARDDRAEVVEIFRNLFNKDNELILCKRDGSLDEDYGFELVSTNCTFDYHKNYFWNEFFKLNPNTMVKAYHGKSCGIHIHFSREAFTDNQLRRLNCFYNNPQNRCLIEELAGREANGYCHFNSYIEFNSSIKTYGSDNKYRVINFNNTDTVEVRIFRSNIKKISFFRYLEFVHTVNLWIRSNQKNNSDNLHHNDYFDWLLKNVHKDYVNLLIFLDDKGYFEHLKYIEEWKPIFLNFKNIVHDFRIDNSELINQEEIEGDN